MCSLFVLQWGVVVLDSTELPLDQLMHTSSLQNRMVVIKKVLN